MSNHNQQIYLEYSHHLVVAWNESGDIILSTLKGGQTYLRQFYKTSHFEVEIRGTGPYNHVQSELVTDDYYFYPFDENHRPYKEMFSDLGISHISDLWKHKKHKIVIRNPLNRFYSGLTEVADSLITLPSEDRKHAWVLPIVFNEIGEHHIGKTLQKTGEFRPDMISNQSYSDLLSMILKNVDREVILENEHLLPWLHFVERIVTDNSELIELSELKNHVKFGETEASKDRVNVKSNIYKNWISDEYHISFQYLKEYKGIYQVELLAYNNLKKWMNQKKS